MDKEAAPAAKDPAAAVLARLDGPGEICGSEPPRDGRWGDCWCTLDPGHDGDCLCEICHLRHGAPGWPNPAQRYDAMVKKPLSVEACAAIRRRLEDGTTSRRTVSRRDPQ